MKLPKKPFHRKVEEKAESINNNTETENTESINTYSDYINTGNPDSESESPKPENTDAKNTDTKNIYTIITMLWNKFKPFIVSFFVWIIAEVFKVPKIVSLPICIVIIYFGYFVKIPNANEVFVIERLGVPRKDLIERQCNTAITSDSEISSRNPFRRLVFLIPIIDKVVKKVNLAHTEIDMPPYKGKTIGRTEISLNSYVLIVITDAISYTYKAKNVESIIHESTKNQIVNLVATKTIEEVLTSVAQINNILAQNINTFIDSDLYGFKLVKLVIQSIDFPSDIDEAMSKREIERMEGEALREKTRKEGEALREKAEQELRVAETKAKSDVIAAQGYAESTKLRTEVDAERQRAMLKPYADAGVAYVYAQGEALKNFPKNSTLFYGGGGGISPNTAYMADVIKHSTDKTSTPTANASVNTSTGATSTETEE